MAQATRSIAIDVPPEKLFDVIADYAKYPEFLPEVKKVTVDHGTGDVKDVTYVVDMKAKTVTYTLRHTGQRPSKLSWTMLKGEVMKADDGHWLLEPDGQGGTKATYFIDLKLSAFVPSFLEKALAEQSLPAMLAAFKKRAETLHPKGKA